MCILFFISAIKAPSLNLVINNSFYFLYSFFFFLILNKLRPIKKTGQKKIQKLQLDYTLFLILELAKDMIKTSEEIKELDQFLFENERDLEKLQIEIKEKLNKDVEIHGFIQKIMKMLKDTEGKSVNQLNEEYLGAIKLFKISDHLIAESNDQHKILSKKKRNLQKRKKTLQKKRFNKKKQMIIHITKSKILENDRINFMKLYWDL